MGDHRSACEWENDEVSLGQGQFSVGRLVVWCRREEEEKGLGLVGEAQRPWRAELEAEGHLQRAKPVAWAAAVTGQCRCEASANGHETQLGAEMARWR